ncbi:MAG: alpha/beta hydrolase [Acholeplasmataceae bacterium]|nr:alpha/beta hydrolase [Acholeplasmataceae bacterium]HOA63455.1 alpha/beta fold hydrolase [Bacilli bacterium]HPT89262.1 alpha/beta fold hydrolase [Bacilli bacterium]HQD92224.1 alpha/beta fold hydrolase [Bacilli bacterium]
MSVEYVEFKNNEGLTIRGFLNKPENFNGTIVVYYHGFTGNKTEHGRIFKTFSEIIAREGFASLRMDFSGNGESDGSFNQMTFKTILSEAKQMLDYVRSINGVKKTIVLGFSMGGAVASQITKNYPDLIDAVLLWSPAGNISEIIMRAYENSTKLPNGDADYAGWVISKELVTTAKSIDFYEGLTVFNKPCLVIHGSADLSVHYSWGEKYANSYPRGRFILIDKAPHGYNSVAFREKLFFESLEFLKTI